MSDSDLMQAVVANLQSCPFPKLGDLVTGKVLKMMKNKCLVDLCDGQAVGIIEGKEAIDSVGTYDRLQVGGDVQAVVVEDEDEEGYYVLSLRKAAQNTAWDRFEKMYKSGEIFEVKVNEANKGGLLLEVDSIKAFLPVSQLAPMHYPRVNEANSQEILRRLQKLIGLKCRVRIIALDRENGKLIVSERAAEEEGRLQKLKRLHVGDSVQGKVSGIVKFGLFVAFDGLEGLVHISEIAWGHVKNPADHAKLGDAVDVQIIGIEGEKISLSMKRLLKDPWVEAAEKYKVGTKVKGPITRITTFGAFVSLEKDINGLIHLSEISHDKVTEVDKVLKSGQVVEAQVIAVDLEEHRIGLSMKVMMAAPVTAAAPAPVSAPAPVTASASVNAPLSTPADDALGLLAGVPKKSVDTLRSAGYTREKLKSTSVEDLQKLEGIGLKTAEKILAAAKQ